MFAITLRRFIVFKRETRQIILVLAPFINILNLILFVQSFENLVVATSPLDTKPLPIEDGDENNPDEIDPTMQGSIMEIAIGFTFPFIMIYGFATCSGIYLLTPVSEREFKTRTLLNMSGVSTLQYWLGLLIGDLLLFIPPMSIFILLTVMFQIKPYCEYLDEYCVFAFAFGTSLVTATYFFSSFFDNTNGAIRCIVPFYLIIGTLIPMSLTVYIYKTPDLKQYFWRIHTPMIFCNPFYAFFFINYSFIRHKMVNDWAEHMKHTDFTPKEASSLF
jgi:hypothetical protein